MNLPLHEIHDALHSYGFLIFPTLMRDNNGHLRWIAYFARYGIKFTDKYGFHNCTIEQLPKGK